MKGGALLNASQASEYLGCSRPTFYKQHRKHLKRYRFGGQGIWLYRVSDLDAIKSQVEEEPAA